MEQYCQNLLAGIDGAGISGGNRGKQSTTVHIRSNHELYATFGQH